MAQGPEGGRTLEQYEEMLGFKKEDLENQTVLDLGAGPKARLLKDLKKAGIKANVVSLSPDYINDEYFNKDKDKDELMVAGSAEDISFKNESFDTVLALFS